MPTSDQIMRLLQARGSLRLAEIKNYFHLNGGWVKPLTDVLDGLIAAGAVYRSGNDYLAEVRTGTGWTVDGV